MCNQVAAKPEMPKSVQIGPIAYTVQHSHEAATEYGKAAGEDIWGCCQNRVSNIIVDQDCPVTSKRRILLHEVLHAANWVYDLKDSKLGDEHTIDQYATVLLDALRRNPELVAYLMGE